MKTTDGKDLSKPDKNFGIRTKATRIVISGTIGGYERLKGMSLEELSEKLGIAVIGVDLKKKEVDDENKL